MRVVQEPANELGVHALFKSITSNDIALMQSIVSQKTNLIFERDRKGWSAVHYAARVGNVEIMKYLVERGAAVKIQDLFGMTPLAIAFYHRHDSLAGYLVNLLYSNQDDRPQLPHIDGTSVITSCSLNSAIIDEGTVDALSEKWHLAEGTIVCHLQSVNSNGGGQAIASIEHNPRSRSIQKALVSAAVIAVCEDQPCRLKYLMSDAGFHMSARKCAFLALIAVSRDAPLSLEYLLDSPSMAAWRGWGNQSLLHIAAKNGAVHCAEVLLRKSPKAILRAADDLQETAVQKGSKQLRISEFLSAKLGPKHIPDYVLSPNPFTVTSRNFPDPPCVSLVQASALFGTITARLHVGQEIQKLKLAHAVTIQRVLPECARVYCQKFTVRTIQRRATTFM